MNKKIILITVLILAIIPNSIFSQDLFVTRDDFTNQSLLEVDKTNGNILDTYNYSTGFPGFEPLKSLIYDTESKEIYGISSNTSSSTIDGSIIKFNIETNTESSISLPTLSGGNYGDIIIANDRLFVTRDDFTNQSLLEVDKTNGNILSTYNYTTSFPGSEPLKSLIYNTESKEIYGISSNTSSSTIDGSIIKFNIETNTESSISLPTLAGGNYGDIIIANDRLFVTRDDFTNQSLLELDKTNGNILSTYNYTTSFPGFEPLKSLIYNTESREIYGISSNTSSSIIDGSIIKLNIETNTESSISLPTLAGGNYGDIILTIENTTLSINDFSFLDNNSKVVKGYNLLGQEIPIDTFNEIIILIYENGAVKKAYNKK